MLNRKIINSLSYILAISNLPTLILAKKLVKEIEEEPLFDRPFEIMKYILSSYRADCVANNEKWDKNYIPFEVISKELKTGWGVFFKTMISSGLDIDISLEGVARLLSIAVHKDLSTHRQRLAVICYILTSRRLLRISEKNALPGNKSRLVGVW